MDKEITHENLKFFYAHLENEQEVQEVVSFMRERNIKITIIENSVGYANDLRIGDRFIYRGGHYEHIGYHLLNHVRNYDRFLEFSKSLTYQYYLKHKKLFEDVDKFFNN